MKTRTLIGATLLLATTTIGLALAAESIGRRHSEATAGLGRERGEHGHLLAWMTGEGHSRDHDDAHRGSSERKHHESDDDDDDEGGAGAARPQADPAAPLPDNGLFQGGNRPRVQVQ